MAGALRRYDDQNAHSYEPCIYPSKTRVPLTEAHETPYHRFRTPDRTFYNNAIVNLMTAEGQLEKYSR